MKFKHFNRKNQIKKVVDFKKTEGFVNHYVNQKFS